MTHATKLLGALGLSAVGLGLAAPAHAAPLDTMQVRVNGMTHAMVLGDVYGYDPSAFPDMRDFRKDPRAYMVQDRSRLGVVASQGDYEFVFQTTFGGEATTYGSALPVNSLIDMLDLYARFPFFGLGRLTVGQFKVPYGRELLQDDRYLLFNDRSLNNLAFQLNRDYGAALDVAMGDLSLTGAIVSLGSRNVPPRYIPEIFGVPGIVARVGYGNERRDLQLMKQTGWAPDALTYGLYLNGIYSKDSAVGHGSVFGNRTSDKNLIFNRNYNHLIGYPDPALGGDAAQGNYVEWGLNGGVGLPMMGGVVHFEGEFNRAAYDNLGGSLLINGGQGTVGVDLEPMSFNLRYAVLFPDMNMRYTDAAKKKWPIFKTPDPLQELTPSFTYKLQGDNLRLIVDAPLQLSTLVFHEKNNGGYVFNNQPDQVSYVADSPSSSSAAETRQTAYQIRVGVVAQF